MAEYMHSYAFDREKSQEVETYFGDGLALIGFSLKLGVPLYYLRSCLLLLNMRSERIEQILKPTIQTREVVPENAISKPLRVSASGIICPTTKDIIDDLQEQYLVSDLCNHCGKPDKLYVCANCGKTVCKNCLSDAPINLLELMRPYHVYVVC